MIPGANDPLGLRVVANNYVYSIQNVAWTDLELILTAMNDAGRYRLVLVGQENTGMPLLKAERLTP